MPNTVTELSKPSEDVRRLFDRKAQHKDGEQKSQLLNSSHKKRKRPALHYDSEDSDDRQKCLIEASRRNTKKSISRTVENPGKMENLHHAVQLRMGKQKHTDFYFKLHELKERIEVYNEIFLSRVPKYMKRNIKVRIIEAISDFSTSKKNKAFKKRNRSSKRK